MHAPVARDCTSNTAQVLKGLPARSSSRSSQATDPSSHRRRVEIPVRDLPCPPDTHTPVRNATRIHGSHMAARPRRSCADRTSLQVGHRIPQLAGAVRDQPDMRIAAARSNGCWQFGQIRVVAIESPPYRRVRNAAYLWQWKSALVADLAVPISGPYRRKIDPLRSHHSYATSRSA